MSRALVLGSSKGIGQAIAQSLSEIECEVVRTSRKDLDTSNLQSVKDFAYKQDAFDILVLNTGGPPSKNFFEYSEEELLQYHNQLFLSFCILLKELKINSGGYIFLMSSHLIKEPNNENLLVSSAYRLAFWSVLKGLGRHYAKKNISCINIAPGPIKTQRLISLVDDMDKFEQSLPFQKAGDPEEIGRFIASIVEKNIKYIHATTILFDGGLSQGVL